MATAGIAPAVCHQPGGRVHNGRNLLSPAIAFGGVFGYYRGGYYGRRGGYSIGGILGLILIVLLIVWLLRGHLGGFWCWVGRPDRRRAPIRDGNSRRASYRSWSIGGYGGAEPYCKLDVSATY